MSQAGVPDPNVRASDADRERIVEQLRQHTADGRLTMDEFEERMTAAYAAKTYRDLAQLTRDLPVDLGAQSRGRAGSGIGTGSGTDPGQWPGTGHDWSRGPFGRPAGHAENNNPSEIVNALIGAAMDWKTQKQQLRDQLRAQRHQVRLAKRAAQPIAAGFAGWAFLSALLTGIWFLTGVTSGWHFGDFWPAWPIGIVGFLTVTKAIKTTALRRELSNRR